jgi:predicted GIY-YIG superfamily endonuclease
MFTIYALKLANETYYIGKTRRCECADIRFQEHNSGNGSEWTKLHKPISIIETYENDSHLKKMFLQKNI